MLPTTDAKAPRNPSENQRRIGNGLLLRRAQRALARAVSAGLVPYNVSYPGFSVLYVLWRNNGVTQSDLPALVDIDKATLTPIIDGLQRAGLIERRQDARDRRRNNLFLTARGRSLEKPLIERTTGIVESALLGLSAEQLATFRAGLLRILENLGEPV